MHKRKVIEVWNALSEAEKKQFLNLLSVAKKNGPANAWRLAHYLSITKLSQRNEQNAWEVLYPGKEYDESGMNKQFTYLTERLEAFLVDKQLTIPTPGNTFKRDLVYLDICLKKKLLKAFVQKRKRIEKKHLAKPVYGISYYENLYTYYQLLTSYYIREDSNPQKRQQATRDYLEALNSLWAAEEVIGSLTLNLVISQNTALTEAVRLLHVLQEQSPFLQLVLIVYQITNERKEPEEGWQKLIKSSDQIDQEDLKRLYFLLFNTVQKRLHLGEEIPLAFMTSMNEIAQDLGFFSGQEKQHLQPLILILCRLRQIEKAENVLNEISEELLTPQDLTIYKFCTGVVAYSKGDYSAMKKAWSTMESPSSYQAILSDILICYSLYLEENQSPDWDLEKDEIIAKLNAVRNRLSTGNIKEGLLQIALLNRIKVFRLFLAQSPDWNQILREINQTHPLNGRAWLKEQAKLRLARFTAE